MTTTNAELRALAEATLVGQQSNESMTDYLDRYHRSVRAFRDAANSTRIIELLDENEDLREQRDSLQATPAYETLGAKLEAAEHQIHRLEREIEENSKRTTLISETSAQRQLKLEALTRFIENSIIERAPAHLHCSWIVEILDRSRIVLAQLKEQP